MNWIKNSYEQFVLAIVALLLLAGSTSLILNSTRLNISIPKATVKNSNLPPLDTSLVDEAAKALANPPKWTLKGHGLFVSEKVLLSPDNKLIPLNREIIGSFPKLHDPVPNTWFLDNNLNITSSTVLTDDPDEDGFSNLVEWIGKDPAHAGSQSTDPQSKDSHPPYVVQLRLKKFIKESFRLVLKAWDGDPAMPESLTFQINTLDVRQPSQFVGMNQIIPRTKFKTVAFQKKEMTDANGVVHDVSELTVVNQETGARIVLVMGQEADSPDSYALFEYLWGHATKRELRVKKDQTFTLEPEADRQFKLIDIQQASALIEDLKTREKVTVPPLEGAGRQ